MIKTDPRTIIDISQEHAYIPEPRRIESVPRQMIHIPKYHWRQDRLDTRDYIYAMSKTQQRNVVDLRPFCSPVEQQGMLGSCTGQAIAGAIELLNKRANRYRDISRLYIYYWERWMIGTVNYDSGAYIRDGIKVTNQRGAPWESYWPYVIRKFTQKPSAIAESDARRRRVTRYERITNIEGCFDALSRGFPIVMGFLVYDSFESRNTARTGIMTYPDVYREQFLGGHAVLLVGYDHRRRVFIARNSWGAGWGDRGYFYMPYAVVEDTGMSFDFWTITGVQNP